MDPVADMLTKIRNALMVSKPVVDVPFSQLKYSIAKILEKNGFVEKVDKLGRGPKRKIRIFLSYKDKKPIISGLKKISKPGRRVYVSKDEIKPVKGGYGIAILSTSKGILTDKEARKQGVGGELICEIW